MSEPRDRAAAAEQRFTIPVLAAALLSIPAAFLTTTGGTTATIGRVLNWVSAAVLLGESLTLLWLSGDVVSWARRYRWQLAVVAVTIPAVVFVVGPVQVLRLLLAIGAFRILRVGRIVRAGRLVVRRLDVGTRWARWVLAGVGVLAAAFAAIVLADPSSRSRRVVAWFVDRIGVLPTILLAVAVAAVVFLVVRRLSLRSGRGRRPAAAPPDAGSSPSRDSA